MSSENDTARARRSKRTGAAAEVRAAQVYGVERYPANTGGKVDIHQLPGDVWVQVKAGAKMPISIILDGLDSARAHALTSGGIGAAHIEYQRAGKREHRKLICFDAEEWAAWNGLPQERIGG